MKARVLIEGIVAALMLVLAAPVLLGIAVAVRLSMGRPVIFSQIRSGLHRHPYALRKFRTMTDALDGNGQLLPDDLRTTRVGAFLRRSRLDELPELWNIVKGEMSFIGPRPLLPPTIAVMQDKGERRCSVRPGLTGWAQTKGGQLLSLSEKLDLDLWYIDHASLRLDAVILWRTLLVVLLGDRRSYAPSSMNMQASTEDRRYATPTGLSSGRAGDSAARDIAEPEEEEPMARERAAGRR
ncbi:sugar transferase [Sphingobium cloacae]|uniref:UDP-phosphate galactose phosphotransferase n=1 Tax=Sphingobium cloacae TaxID=120107 RepID=A0A1E1F522_9SPHN|nr:sugar transferase [Sphingobium cloacae]BAV65625.1 UDP-phosphate galactose phosphotransferase [Sphingobium cloacae]